MVCKKCGSPVEKRAHAIEILGKTHTFDTSTCQTCEEIAEKQAEIARTKQDEIDRRTKHREHIPERYMTASFLDFGPEIDKIRKWCDDPTQFLFIYSPCGVGKTHLACAMAYEMRKADKPTRIFSASTMFLRLRNTFNSDDETENEVIENYSGRLHVTKDRIFNEIEIKKPSVHIFDDIGVQKATEYAISAWYDIINYRYSELLPTVFTSNLSLKEISAYMTDRIASRLASGVVFELKGTDRRLQK